MLKSIQIYIYSNSNNSNNNIIYLFLLILYILDVYVISVAGATQLICIYTTKFSTLWFFRCQWSTIYMFICKAFSGKMSPSSTSKTAYLLTLLIITIKSVIICILFTICCNKTSRKISFLTYQLLQLCATTIIPFFNCLDFT